MKRFVIKKIEKTDSESDRELIHRLYDMGLHPGLEITVVGTVSFNSVTIIQYGNTRMALNEEEFACLHGH